MKKYDVLVIGDINPDIIITGLKKYPGPGEERLVDDLNITPGGGATISSLALAKLGLDIAIYGCIGKDLFSKMLLDSLVEVGVDITNVSILNDTKAGTSIVLSDEKDRSFITYRGALEKLDLYSISDEVLGNCDFCFLHNYDHNKIDEYLDLANRLKKLGKKIIFDVGYDESEQWDPKVFELLGKVDLFVPDELEALCFSGKNTIAEALYQLSTFCPNVVVKAGKQGAYALKDGSIINVPCFPTTVVDSTGAGDSFDAGFIYGMVKGYSLENSLKLANFIGSLSVSAIGGSTGIPSTKELWEKIENLKVIE